MTSYEAVEFIGNCAQATSWCLGAQEFGVVVRNDTENHHSVLSWITYCNPGSPTLTVLPADTSWRLSRAQATIVSDSLKKS